MRESPAPSSACQPMTTAETPRPQTQTQDDCKVSIHPILQGSLPRGSGHLRTGPDVWFGFSATDSLSFNLACFLPVHPAGPDYPKLQTSRSLQAHCRISKASLRTLGGCTYCTCWYLQDQQLGPKPWTSPPLPGTYHVVVSIKDFRYIRAKIRHVIPLAHYSGLVAQLVLVLSLEGPGVRSLVRCFPGPWADCSCYHESICRERAAVSTSHSGLRWCLGD